MYIRHAHIHHPAYIYTNTLAATTCIAYVYCKILCLNCLFDEKIVRNEMWQQRRTHFDIKDPVKSNPMDIISSSTNATIASSHPDIFSLGETARKMEYSAIMYNVYYVHNVTLPIHETHNVLV